MARIEISMSEYDSLKDRIKELEFGIIDVTKEVTLCMEKYDEAKFLIENLENESLFNRVFKWKSVIKPIIELLNGKSDKQSS